MVRALGFRLAARAPPCAKMDTWQLLVDACVAELAGSQNAPALLVALPLLARAPLPLVLRFFASPEREPMNKLRSVLTHDQSDVRCAAIAACARLTVDVAVNVLTADGLLALPFESHEARVCCQQDVWTIVVDTWKLIFQALFPAGDQRPAGSGTVGGGSTAGSVDSVGAALVAMHTLFSRGSALNTFNVVKEAPQTQSAVNDLVSAVFKEAFPRILAIQAAARKLPMRHQVDAFVWIAMLLYMMMDKSGARCPGISLPYVDIDMVAAPSDDGDADDDDDNHLSGSSCRARVDQLATDVLEAWICPLLARKASLAQSSALCRAAFVLLSHPLMAFARLQRAPMLVRELVAQCFFHKSSELKLEMSQMLVKVFAWVTADTCVPLFVRVVEALSLMERETCVAVRSLASVAVVCMCRWFVTIDNLECGVWTCTLSAIARDFFSYSRTQSATASCATKSFCCLSRCARSSSSASRPAARRGSLLVRTVRKSSAASRKHSRSKMTLRPRQLRPSKSHS